MPAQNQDEIAKTLLTIRDYIRYAMSRFGQAKVYFGHGADNGWDEALHLILPLLHLSHDTDERILDATLSKNERQHLIRLIETRVNERLPVPYITGEAYFAGMTFVVDERVLIPRSPIAELLENNFQPWLQTTPSRILDLCTGSGCIGLACAAYLDADVCLADISTDALEVARKNIALHDMQDVAELCQSDLFDNVSGKFDLIVSNPPYVDAEDLAAMPAEYHHEPQLALEAGTDGLIFAKEILEQAAKFLTDKGLLVMEVGNSWVHLEQAYPEVPFTWIEFERGGHGVLVFNKAELEQYF